MDPKTLATIKQKLLAEEAELGQRLRDIGTSDPRVDDNYKSRFPDYGTKEDENAAEVAAFSDRIAIEQTTEVDLKAVKDALQRIADGTYGQCRYCGKPIEEKRLLIRPTSGSCIACKRTHDIPG